MNEQPTPGPYVSIANLPATIDSNWVALGVSAIPRDQRRLRVAKVGSAANRTVKKTASADALALATGEAGVGPRPDDDAVAETIAAFSSGPPAGLRDGIKPERHASITAWASAGLLPSGDLAW